MNAPLKKGILDVCILHLGAQAGELYGYDLMRPMKGHFPDIDESTFYAILRRLHQNGLTEAISKDSPSGPPRKYYSLTAQGRDWLAESVDEWRSLQAIVRAIGIE